MADLLVPDIQKKNSAGIVRRSMAFTRFVLFETWLVPGEAGFVDKYGPPRVLIGGILCAWMGDQRRATSGSMATISHDRRGRPRRLWHLASATR